jgi:hypothetical protein
MSETGELQPVVERRLVRRFRLYGGCDHHANVHEIAAETPEDARAILWEEYGPEYRLSEASEIKSGACSFPSDLLTVHIEIETEKDRDGRQRFWCYWLDHQGIRGQIFHADLASRVDHLQRLGKRVVLYSPNVRVEATPSEGEAGSREGGSK